MRPISGLAAFSVANSVTNRNDLRPIAASFALDNIAIIESPEFGATAG
jgi:hypothetical protein